VSANKQTQERGGQPKNDKSANIFFIRWIYQLIERWKTNPKAYGILFALFVLFISQGIFQAYAFMTDHYVFASPLLSFFLFAIAIPLVYLPVRDFSSSGKSDREKTERLIEERTQELNFRIEYFTKEIDKLYLAQCETGAVPVGTDNLFKYLIACVDKFVDEAQQVLTSRAKSYYIFGTMSIIAAVGALVYAGLLAYESLSSIDQPLRPGSLAVYHPTQYVVMRIFSALAVATAIYAIVKTTLSYGISFFHEGTRLLDRRHALRFGRLYMYLKREKFEFEELEEAFQWHMDAQTIFQSISASKITDGVFNQLIKSISDAAEAISKVKKLASPSVESSKKDSPE